MADQLVEHTSLLLTTFCPSRRHWWVSCVFFTPRSTTAKYWIYYANRTADTLSCSCCTRRLKDISRQRILYSHVFVCTVSWPKTCRYKQAHYIHTWYAISMCLWQFCLWSTYPVSDNLCRPKVVCVRFCSCIRTYIHICMYVCVCVYVCVGRDPQFD
jgi:hypothetical protein